MSFVKGRKGKQEEDNIQQRKGGKKVSLVGEGRLKGRRAFADGESLGKRNWQA